MVDAKYLSNHELQYELEKLGFSPGPILHLLTQPRYGILPAAYLRPGLLFVSTRLPQYVPALDPIPVGLQLAVFGIFIIVVFVYFTVERKSFFA
ncbi:LEM domain-containing protein 1 [Suncus etruscus]|uniref:LEM domain-containing protein 1 n=1 Tax=Suncus etruscus TaxID=109475 RepID=UPI00210F3E93|nr:LEM domain-containing protein 1 [Suncus etruscus]